MFFFLHNFHPTAILLSFGPIHIYWYGLFIVLGMVAALLTAFYLARKYELKRDLIFDLAFWLIIWGIIGARVYDIFLQLPYYLNNPGQMLKIWEGGLSIHGGIIAGLIVTAWFAKKYLLGFWKLSAVLVPGIALGQAIGRWGNYFNQELFGRPTNLPWGIPIDIMNRPLDYLNDQYFQPTFLYESLGCLVIFAFLLSLHNQYRRYQHHNNLFFVWISALYMILYSILRFSLEFIKINPTPVWLGLRWPQIISLLIILTFVIILLFKTHASKNKK
jgi:phosphatidylglycerol:prolipoprotein diacylglycerol transferase